MATEEPETLTGENRCWPCTVANSVVGLFVGWVPLAAALTAGDGSVSVLAAALVWGVVVTGATGYLLVSRGYLPLAEPVAKATGLHERIGPGRDDAGDERDHD